MLPKLRRFLGSKPYRSSKRSASGHGKELQNDINSPEESFFEESFRIRTSSIDENTLNQELHFIVDYLGYCQVSEVQSISLLLESVKRVKKGYTEPRRVDFVIKEGVLKISRVGGHALILTVPLYIVALCAQESLRGFDKCFGINITRKNAHLCYVFQAGSSLEVMYFLCRLEVSTVYPFAWFDAFPRVCLIDSPNFSFWRISAIGIFLSSCLYLTV